MDQWKPNDDEAWVFECQARGQLADFRARPAGSGQQPVLRAEVLRRWILGLSLEDAEKLPSCGFAPVGLQIRGAIIQGRLRLADASGSHGDSACPPLVFESCRFQTDDAWPLPHERAEPTVDLRHARCSRIALVDCELASLALDDAWVGGDLDLSGLHAADEGGQCWVRARGCRIQGSVTLSRARLRVEQALKTSDSSARKLDYACDLIGTRVEGDLIGRDGLLIAGGLALPRQVGGDMVLDGAQLSHTLAIRNDALRAQSCEIAGVMSLRPQQKGEEVQRFECTGRIEMYGLTVGGTLTLSGAQLSCPLAEGSDTLIRAYLLNVRGSVFMDDWMPAVTAGGPPPQPLPTFIAGGGLVDLRCASIGTDLFMSLEQEGPHHILGGGMRVDGQVSILRARHQISIEAMQVGRDLSIDAAEGELPAIEAYDTRVGGNFWLRGSFGNVRAWGAQVQGEFGRQDYTAAELVLGDVRVQGESRLRASTGLVLSGALLVGRVTVHSLGSAPGITIDARHLSAERSLGISGPVRSLNLTAAKITGSLSVDAAEAALTAIEAQDAHVGGNFWLKGSFGDLRAWGAQVQGEFGRQDYEAASLALGDLRVQGVARLRASAGIFLEGAVLAGRATITSLGKLPGIQLAASNLTAQRDLIIEGPVRELQLSAARIDGSLTAISCSVNDAKLDSIRVQGGALLPRNVFGEISLVGGRFDSWVRFEGTRLHLRRRPTGNTRPKLDFRDARINGDLQVQDLERVPLTGVLEEVGDAPDWIGQLAAAGSAASTDKVRLFRRSLSFYDSAEIVEFHLDSHGTGDLVEVHAFLLLNDTQTVYLNGDSSPIHRVNGLEGSRKPLRLESPEQATDYLAFFCGYVWGEEGAFVIMDSLEESEWLRYAERISEKFSDLSVPPKVERVGDAWHFQAVVRYADYLFRASFSLQANGTIDMTDDVAIARLQPADVRYAKPLRQYPLLNAASAPEIGPARRHSPQWVMLGANPWLAEDDPGQIGARIERVHAALTTTSKRQVPTDSPLPVVIDLRGCQCGSLEDDHGSAWGQGLTVDLRGFEYVDLAEGTATRRREANEAFAGPGLSIDGAMGAELGRQRYQWLERVTHSLAFSVAPYEQLVRSLSGRGDQEAARTVLERRLQQENAHRPWWTRWGIWLGVQLPFRFGLFSQRGILATLLYWLLGIVAFDVANYGQLRFPPVGAADSGLIVAHVALPVRPVLVVDSQPVTMSVVSTAVSDKLVTFKVPPSDDQADEVRCGDQIEPSVYALDVMLPLVDLHQEAKCTISAADGWGPFAWRAFRALYALGGAYMTSMLILTLSGVLRRSIER